jgi:hypothetical protein
MVPADRSQREEGRQDTRGSGGPPDRRTYCRQPPCPDARRVCHRDLASERWAGSASSPADQGRRCACWCTAHCESRLGSPCLSVDRCAADNPRPPSAAAGSLSCGDHHCPTTHRSGSLASCPQSTAQRVGGETPHDDQLNLNRRSRIRGELEDSWNGSWNGGGENPSVLGAVVALSCGIGAGSGPKAREHASCKRQVSGSNPLTGSQVNEGPRRHPQSPEGRQLRCANGRDLVG